MTNARRNFGFRILNLFSLETRGFTLILFFILTLPLSVLILSARQIAFPAFYEWSPVLLKAGLQAALSALGSVGLGYLGAIGLMGMGPRTAQFCRVLFLIPNFIPALFIALSFLNLWTPFPFGLIGIVLIQVAINSGLVAVQIFRTFQTSFMLRVEHALVDGASFWTFWRRAGWSESVHVLGQLFIFVFAICFSSFLIPLIVGGGTTYSLEVLIYEHFRFDENLRQALGCALIQLLAFFIFAAFAKVQILPDRQGEGEVRADGLLREIGKPILAVPVLVLSSICIVGLGFGWGAAMEQLRSLPLLQEELPLQILTSLSIGLGSGVMILILLLLTVLFSPAPYRHRLLNSFQGSGAVLTGLALVLIARFFSVGAQSPALRILMTAFGIACVFFPFLFRLRWRLVVQKIAGQIQMAQTLGASSFQIASRITWPQVWPTACDLAGLAAFWAVGDFAVSSFLLSSDSSLSLAARGLMGVYRLELATAYVGLALGLGAALWFFFKGMSYVVRS